MASFESEATKIINKFNGGNFNLWKFKIEMLLASMNIWDIVDGAMETPPSNADSKVLKEYQRRVKKTISIIGLNLAGNQLARINGNKKPLEILTTFFNIHETKNLSNMFFVNPKFFTCKMQEGDNLLDHINKVKSLLDQLACLEVYVRDKNIVIILFKSLLASFKYLITALQTMSMNELTMDYITAPLTHKMSNVKRKSLKVRMPSWSYDKTKMQLIFVPRCKIMLLFLQTMFHCAFLLQKKTRFTKMQRIQRMKTTTHFTTLASSLLCPIWTVIKKVMLVRTSVVPGDTSRPLLH